jgi:hypothetical protein
MVALEDEVKHLRQENEDLRQKLEDQALTGGKLFGEVNAARSGIKHHETEEEAEERDKRKFFDSSSPSKLRIFGLIARHQYFEWITLGVIVFNALYLGYDCDYNARWGKPEDLYASSLWGFMLLDNFFCLFFTAEVVIRFLGYRSKCFVFKEKAFLFDLFLVVMMILETWVLAFIGTIAILKQVSILRLLRLTRLLRMGKLMRYCPEMQLIVKGMMAAVRAVGCAGILLLLCLYVFAIIFTAEYHQGHQANDDEDLHEIHFLFGSMGKSLRHLLIMATILDDITACCNAIRSTGNMWMLMAFMVCVLVSSFTLFNMLLGILCEVVTATQNGEEKKASERHLEVTMKAFFHTMDLDMNGLITRDEFSRMKEHEKIMHSLQKLDIDRKQFEKYAELLFTPKTPDGPIPSLNFDAAVAMILRLRPGSNVNKCDYNDFKISIVQGNAAIKRELNELEHILAEAVALQEANDEELDTPMAVLDSEGFADDKEDKQEPLFRSPPTIKRLAYSSASKMAFAPPVTSRWVVDDDCNLPGSIMSQTMNPTSKKGGTKETIASQRLEKLVQKRKLISNHIRQESGLVYSDSAGKMAFYHGALVPKVSTFSNYQPANTSNNFMLSDFSDDEDEGSPPIDPFRVTLS